MHFNELDLDDALVQSVVDRGYFRVTTIQQHMIPQAMAGLDVLASAPTGTGKTLAYLLPVMQHLIDYPRRRPGPPRVLVLVPTRELAYQVLDDAKLLTQNLRLKCAAITGGVSHNQHADALNNDLDVLVATPGRLLEYLDAEVFDARAVEILVIDEADRTLEMGFGQDVERIAAETVRRRQTLLLSATMEGAALSSFSKRLLNEPVEVSAEAPPRREKNKTQQWLFHADNLEHKQALLLHWLRQEDVKKTIVFVKTRERLQAVRALLDQAGLPCLWLAGTLEQSKRLEHLKSFANGEIGILLATDVAARGLHVDDVTHVINFDMPRRADVYVHRIGRTGRAGRKGVAVSLVEAHDIAQLERIERYVDEPIVRRVIQELKPKHKVGQKPVKKKKLKDTKKKSVKEQKPKVKVRKRDTKDKGKPKWLKARESGEASNNE